MSLDSQAFTSVKVVRVANSPATADRLHDILIREERVETNCSLAHVPDLVRCGP